MHEAAPPAPGAVFQRDCAQALRACASLQCPRSVQQQLLLSCAEQRALVAVRITALGAESSRQKAAHQQLWCGLEESRFRAQSGPARLDKTLPGSELNATAWLGLDSPAFLASVRITVAATADVYDLAR